MTHTARNFAGVLRTLNIDPSFWTEFPEKATIQECRAFAKECDLELPTGLPIDHKTRKGAFVAMFMLCHLTPFKLVKLEELGLTRGDIEKLFAYRDSLDKRRHAKNSTSNRKWRPVRRAPSRTRPSDGSVVVRFPTTTPKKVKSSSSSRVQPARNHTSFCLPIDPSSKTGERFKSLKAWHDHNADSTRRFLGNRKKERTDIPASKKSSVKEAQPSSCVIPFTPDGQKVRVPQYGGSARL